MKVFLICSIKFRYDVWFTWGQSIERYAEFDNIYITGLWKDMVFEMCLVIFGPN